MGKAPIEAADIESVRSWSEHFCDHDGWLNAAVTMSTTLARSGKRDRVSAGREHVLRTDKNRSTIADLPSTAP
jgi:hypothetical protein